MGKSPKEKKKYENKQDKKIILLFAKQFRIR